MYSSHGPEVLECTVWPQGISQDTLTARCCHNCRPLLQRSDTANWPVPMDKPQLHLLKLHGDPNVPGGQYSVCADLSTVKRGTDPQWHQDAFFGAHGNLQPPCVLLVGAIMCDAIAWQVAKPAVRHRP